MDTIKRWFSAKKESHEPEPAVREDKKNIDSSHVDENVNASDSEEVEETLPAPVTAIIIGAGSRGSGYSRYALERPDLLKIVGVAEPRKACVEPLIERLKIPEENVFTDWKEAADREKFADFVYIATPDRLHKDPAIAFAKKGYHILLEKPMAVSEEDCESIAAVCAERGIILAVCHVMRYLPQSRRIKTLIDGGSIGDVVNIQLTEPVGYWHFAHSYVRGNWHREEDSTFSLMAKSCHDIDLINYWMSPRKCVKVSSFGTLAHFSKDQKPEGAGSICIDCSIEESCPYSAKRLYMSGNRGWPVDVICDGKAADIENIEEALTSGPYGKCVYECDNDVMSNQTVQFEYEGARLATFTMIAFTSAVCVREVSVYGTRGEIRASLSGSRPVRHKDFVTGKIKEYDDSDFKAQSSVVSGHGGADYYLINNFIRAVARKTCGVEIMTGPDDTLASHKLVFAAERSRRENKVITL